MNEVQPAPKLSKLEQFRNFFAFTILLIAGAVLILGIYNFVQGRQQKAAGEEQIAQTKLLVEEVKRISEENRRLNQTANNYAFCNAVILAEYTQTLQPITIEDLNDCVTSSFPNGEGAPQESTQTSGAQTLQPAQVSQTQATAPSAARPTATQRMQPAASATVQPAAPAPAPAPTPVVVQPLPVNPQPAPVVESEPATITVEAPLLPPVKIETCADLLGIVKTC